MTVPPPASPRSGTRDSARLRLAAARDHLSRSWVGDLTVRLKTLDVANSIMVFGASLLLSTLPLIILLGSLANRHVDGDLSRHMGLDSHGARIVSGLFRHTPTHSIGPVVIGVIIGFAGTMATVSCLQVIYERVFDQSPRGWRAFPRFVVWLAVLLGALILEGIVGKPVRRSAGPVVAEFLTFVAVTIFFWWTMHFLLAGRVPWRSLMRPALATGLFWVGLGLFSSVYFSSEIISDRRLYGAIGAVFSFLTWFIAIGAVIALGAATGAVWEERRGRARRTNRSPQPVH